jgi:hypothetical protein
MDIQHKPLYENLVENVTGGNRMTKLIILITREFKTRCETDLSSSKEYSK